MKLSDQEVHVMLARWLELSDQGKVQESLDRCREDIPNTLDYFLASRFVGYSLYLLHRYEDSTRFLQRACELGPEDYYANYFLAHTLKSSNHPEGALQHFLICAKIAPDNFPDIIRGCIDLVFDQIHSENGKEAANLFLKSNSLAADQKIGLLFLTKNHLELQKQLKGTGFQTLTIKSVAQYSTDCDVEIHKLGNPEQIEFLGPPDGFGPITFRKVVTGYAPYTARLKNVCVVGGSSIVRGQGEAAISDVMADARFGKYVTCIYDKSVKLQCENQLLICDKPESRNIEKAIMMSGLASDQFGHWFAEYLPKLRLFETLEGYKDIPILVDENMPNSHYEFLRLFTSQKLIYLKKLETVRVQNLFIAPTISFCPIELVNNHLVPREEQGNWSSQGLAYMREKVLSAVPSVGTDSRKRIFLSRKHSAWRKLVNEDELIEHLVRKKFNVVFLEDMNFKDQVRLFQQAEFVIAPNGSSLNSLIFAPKSVRVIVLAQEDHFNWGGWLGPMTSLGYKPFFFSGSKLKQKSNSKHADYLVPWAKLNTLIEDIDRGRKHG